MEREFHSFSAQEEKVKHIGVKAQTSLQLKRQPTGFDRTGKLLEQYFCLRDENLGISMVRSYQLSHSIPGTKLDGKLFR